MRLAAWLKPAFVLLFLLAGVSITALGWFGFRLLKQESTVQAQRSQERLEQSANRIATRVRTHLSTLAAQSAWPGDPADALVLSWNRAPARLLYTPFPATDPEASPSAFHDGETFEYRQGQPKLAALWYQRLAAANNPAMRAGALLRLSPWLDHRVALTATAPHATIVLTPSRGFSCLIESIVKISVPISSPSQSSTTLSMSPSTAPR